MNTIEFLLTLQHSLFGTKGLMPVADFLKSEGRTEDIQKMSLKEFQGRFGVNRDEVLSKGIAYFNIRDEIKMSGEKGIQIITIEDETYPKILKTISTPPLAFYVQGNIKFEYELALAIVGTRRPTFYGIESAKRFSRELSRYGLTIVSGLAKGIDTCGHEGALESEGRTIAVLGSGLLKPYPRENRRLIDRIIRGGGAVISELPLKTDPLPHHFPLRNRIISGLSQGVCVVEAAENSGSLITANLALEEGREVYAVPGMVQSLASQGTLKLIQEGAKCVRRPLDILEDFVPYIEPRAQSREPRDKNEEVIV